MENWKHHKTIADNDKFELNGLNIWDFIWESTYQTINIKDPLYHQHYIFQVYKIKADGIEIEFAAGEFSNCI